MRKQERELKRAQSREDEAKREVEHIDMKMQMLQTQCTTLTKELELREGVVQAVERERDAVGALVRQVRQDARRAARRNC